MTLDDTVSSIGDSPEELATWLEARLHQIRPARPDGPGLVREVVDDFVTDILTRVRSERLDPDQIRAVQFPVSPWGARYNSQDVLTLRNQLVDRVLRSPSVSSETDADVPASALDIVHQIESARFRTTRRGGLDEREVDEYLTALQRELRWGTSLNGAEIRARQFSHAKLLVPGYVENDVRRFLDTVASYADSRW